MDPKDIPYNLSIRLLEAGPYVAARVGDGQGISSVVRRDLLRYYSVLESALAEVRRKFSRDEILMVMEAANGRIFSDEGLNMPMRFLWAEVADMLRIQNRIEEHWGFVTRLRDLPAAELAALVDASERFWLHPERDTDELLEELGLVEREARQDGK